MKPTSSSPLSQGNAQLNPQPIHPNQKGYHNGYTIQKPSHPVKKTGDEQECRQGPAVAVNGETDVDSSERFKKPVTHPHSPSSSFSFRNRANGSELQLVNGSQQSPISNMQAVDIHSSTLATAPTATTFISAALAPLPPSPTTPSSPRTPTSFMFHQRRHSTQPDQPSLEVASSVQLPESSRNSNTPRMSSAVGSENDHHVDDGGKGNEADHRATKINIPDSIATASSLSSSSTLGTSSIDHPTTTNPNSNPPDSSSTPTTSRPTSTSIDPSLFSNRPAPPSPALSRRVSGAMSVASPSSTHSRSISRSSRPSSLAMSRASSLRKSVVGNDAKRQSLGTQLSQFIAAHSGTGGGGGGGGARDEGSATPTMATSSSPLGSPHKLTFALNSQSPVTSSAQPASASTSSTHSPLASISTIPILSDPTTTGPIPTSTTTTPIVTATPLSQPTTSTPPPVPSTPSVYIKIRDFGFPPTDERHLGLGTDIPKANRVHRLNRKLGAPDRARARAVAAAAGLDPSSSLTGTAGRMELGSRRTDSIGSMGSVDSSDADAEEGEEEEEDEGWGIGISGWGKGGGKGWDGFKMGMGRFSWTIGSSHSSGKGGASDSNNSRITSSSSSGGGGGAFPSRKDLDMNFMDSSSSSSSDDGDGGGGGGDNDNDNEQRRKKKKRGRLENQGITEEFYVDDDDDDENETENTFDQRGLRNRHSNAEDPDQDENEEEYAEDGEEEEGEEPLYPGLYRALYAFEPEGTAEMKLDEDQIVRVVGRGGGVGWAVVVDEYGSSGVGMPLKHALVPEGYLEAVRLDWEDEEEALELINDGDGDGDAVKAENA